MSKDIPLLCEACEADYTAGPICPECGTETCAQCGWCDECTNQTMHWPDPDPDGYDAAWQDAAEDWQP